MATENRASSNSSETDQSKSSANRWAFWSWEYAHDHMTVSSKFCDILEVTPAQIQHLDQLASFITSENAEEFKSSLQKTVQENCSFEFRGLFTTATGARKQLQFQGDCLLNFNDEIIGVTGICIEILAKESAEDHYTRATQENEEYIIRLLEQSPDSLLIHTTYGVILYANRTACDLFQFPASTDMVGRSIENFLIKDGINTIKRNIKAVIESNETTSGIEIDITCTDGSSKITTCSLIPFYWGGSTAVLTVLRDITEQKRYLGDLQSSEGNLKQLIKSIPLSLAMYDEQMNYIACSSKFLKDWWVKDEEMNIEKIIGLNHYDVFEDVRDDWKKFHRKCLQGATILKEDDFFIKADGKKEWLRWQITPWQGMHGKIQGLIIFTEFITKRKETEQLIRNSRQKLSTILENLPGMVYGCDNDADWTMNFVSNGSIELTGYAPEEFLQKENPVSFKDITHPDDVPYVWDVIKQGLQNKDIFEIEYRIYTKNGELKYLFERGQGVFNEYGELLSLEGIILDISERKEAENELKNSEANLAEAQRVANIGSWEWTAGTHELRWSDEFYRIYGLEPHEIEPSFHACIQMLHADDKISVSKAFRHLLRSKEPYQLDARIITKTDELKYVTFKAEILTNETGKTTKIVGSIQDITEKKKAEIALLNSENRNKALLGALPDIIFTLTVDGIFLDCQIPEHSSLIFPPDRILGKRFTDIFHESTASKFIEKFKKAHEQNTIEVLDYTLDLKGELKYFEARIARYNEGEVLVIIRDITQSRESERKARESELRFIKAFQISPIPIIISHLDDGKILEANDKFMDLIQMTRDEVVGSNTVTLGTWVNSKNRRKFLRELEQKGKIHGFEAKLKPANNKLIHVLLSAEYINIEGKVCILLMIFDITERKRGENQLLALMQELTTSNHELRQFAYITSHNLRAPVVNIDTLMQFLDRQNLASPENEEVLSKIELSVAQLKETLHDLIQLVAVKDSRNEPNEKIYFEDIYKIISKSLATQIIKSQAIIHTEFKETCIMFKKPLLESILQNLISNAIKYKSDKALSINIRTYREGEYICMSVEDNGMGIDLSEHKDRLFGMYQRFHENIDGKGLGLYIIKSQIESMGGKIDVESAPGEGSTFKVYFKIQNDKDC